MITSLTKLNDSTSVVENTIGGVTTGVKGIFQKLVEPITTIGLILVAAALIFLIVKTLLLWTKRKEGNAEEIKKHLKWNIAGILLCLVLLVVFSLLVTNVFAIFN